MRTLILLGLLVTSALGQAQESKQTPAAQPPEAPPPTASAVRATRHSFMLVSTRAIALFRSADSIEDGLRADGSTLHPSTITLRLRIEHALDQAESAIDKGDLEQANNEIKLAGELVSRFARRIGGE